MNDVNKRYIVNFFKQLLEVYDFELIIDINQDLENVFRLNDIQKGNLGGIEQEEFLTLADIIDRLDSYHQDYIYNPLELKQSNNEKLSKDDWDLVAKRYLESDEVADVLSDINPKNYVDFISKKEKFEIEKLIKILDEEEQFYKTVCKKYVDTMSKEMILESENKILHIYIKDEYIDLKKSGKINIQNYKEYLDEDFELYEYDSYQDLYNSVIKDEVVYDLNDLELVDDEENWVFYLTFEELKRIGYGFMVKDQFPLIEKYVVSEEAKFDFYSHFSIEQLKDFENSLDQYFNEKSIVYQEDIYEQFESREDVSFNRDILRLACGLISYEDFINDYTEQPIYEFDKYNQDVDELKKVGDEANLKEIIDELSENNSHLFSGIANEVLFQVCQMKENGKDISLSKNDIEKIINKVLNSEDFWEEVNYLIIEGIEDAQVESEVLDR